MLGDRYPRPINGNAPQSITAARTTTIAESVAMGAGILVIGAAYVFSVISPAGLAVACGTVLTLSGVMMMVAAWTAERGERHARLIAMVLDRHERDRTTEYGAIMRKITFVEGHADNLIGQTMQRIDDMGARIEQMWVACDAAEARRNVEHHAALDALSEAFASELLAINGATGGLRAAVEDVIKSRTVADEIYKTAADLGVHPANFLIRYKAETLRASSADPIAELVTYKVQSGDLPRTRMTDSGDVVEHLPYCETIKRPLDGPEICNCVTKPSEAEGE